MDLEIERTIHRSKIRTESTIQIKQNLSAIKPTKHKKIRKRPPIKNHFLPIHQVCLMTFLLSSILALLLLLDLTPFSKGNDYLYTDDEELDKSQRGGVRVVDPEDDKDVWPIMD